MRGHSSCNTIHHSVRAGDDADQHIAQRQPSAGARETTSSTPARSTMASTRLRPPISANGWRRSSERLSPTPSGSLTKASGSSRSFLPRSSTGRNRRKERSGTRSTEACAKTCESALAVEDLTPRAPQRGCQSLPLLFPAGVLGLRSFVDGLDLGPEGRSPIRFTLLCDVHSARHLPGNRLTDGEKLPKCRQVVSDKPFVLRSSG